MVVDDNHNNDARSSLSSTCLPAGFQDSGVGETGFEDVEEAQEIDFSTVGWAILTDPSKDGNNKVPPTINPGEVEQ